MKRYVKLDTSLRERLLFLFTGIIAEDCVTIVTPGKREIGSVYTHYPIFPDPQGPPPPTPEYKSCAPDKPTPPPKPPSKKRAGVEPNKPWPRTPDTSTPKSKPPPPPKPPAMRVVREDILAVSREEKIPDIPFFELEQDKVKSNL